MRIHLSMEDRERCFCDSDRTERLPTYRVHPCAHHNRHHQMARTLRRLLPALLVTLPLLAPTIEVTAQEIPHDVRTIRLRLIGQNAEPIEYKSGAINFLDREKVASAKDRWETSWYNSFFQRDLILPDQEFSCSDFPVDIEVLEDRERMELRLDADVGTLRFREGIYHIPWSFEALFALRGLNGTKILEQDIACFEVFDRSEEPHWPTYQNDSARPLLLDTTESRANGSTSGYSPVRATDWREKGFSLMLHSWYGDPRGPDTRGRLYRLDRDGRDFQTREGSLVLQRSARVIAMHFSSPEQGWIVVDTGSGSSHRYVHPYQTWRTGDGGDNWQLDEEMTRLRICSAIPRNDQSAWFLGFSQIDESEEILLHLYTGRTDGSNFTEVNWPASLNRRVPRPAPWTSTRLPRLLPAGENGLILSYTAAWNGSRQISFDARIDRVTDIPGVLEGYHQGPDGTGWMIVQDTLRRKDLASSQSPYTDARFHRPFRLIRVSSDGMTTRSVLTSGHDIHAVSFADAATGVVVGNAFLLLTRDGGRSWQYLPGRSAWSNYGVRRGPVGENVITALWPTPDLLRLVTTAGTLDIPIGAIPAPKSCVPSEASTIQRAEIN